MREEVLKTAIESAKTEYHYLEGDESSFNFLAGFTWAEFRHLAKDKSNAKEVAKLEEAMKDFTRERFDAEDLDAPLT